MLIRTRKSWEVPERSVTPAATYWNRRTVIKGLGLAAIGSAGIMAGGGLFAQDERMLKDLAGLQKVSARHNDQYAVGDRPPTGEALAARYNNFYEFSRDKDDVFENARDFKPRPWAVEVGGLVNKPRAFDVDDLLKRMPIEERIYRFRCVEAWSMVVPWIGFPVKGLLDEVQPKSNAKYVKMTTFLNPQVAHRQTGNRSGYGEPWPYTEGLTMAEANNELALFALGIYGHVLPKQHGAPIRLVVPWKYGFKNIKSIVKIELVEQQPPTFWNTLAPSEYGFESNVNPRVPHPRWSQAFERQIQDGKRVPTLLYNGYAEQVGSLYSNA
jgi:sulfoxide reductase catalytic subunit YedY